MGGIPLWLVIVVVARDLLLVLGYGIIYFLVEERLDVKPTVVGKWSTTLQLLTLAVALVTLDQPKLLPSLTLDLFVGVTAVLTVVSGCQYLYRGLVWLQTKAPSITRLG
jgi:cardiolipin synthase